MKNEKTQYKSESFGAVITMILMIFRRKKPKTFLTGEMIPFLQLHSNRYGKRTGIARKVRKMGNDRAGIISLKNAIDANAANPLTFILA